MASAAAWICSCTPSWIGAGQAITFEFRADHAGTFEFYCNLTADPACREMKGTLVVKGKE